MVGDDLEKDIQGALEFGFSAILYDPINKYPDYQGKKVSNLMMITKNR
ncbi:MAG: HAD hydrolase-like protein [Bacteroidales bacterium]|nr:HAD hydrolase-like protein [Bacteroidales bacterium]